MICILYPQTLDIQMNGQEIVYLYQLKEGHRNSSYACNIADLVGVPDSIIHRGKEVNGCKLNVHHFFG